MKEKILLSIIFLFGLQLLSCSHDDPGESNQDPDAISTIHFNRSDYTIMIGGLRSIPFSGGGGVYKLEASNPEVLGKFGIDIETHRLLINPTKTGQSTLTIFDEDAEVSVTLNITVEDFYRSFKIVEIEGKNTNKFFRQTNYIRFIRNTDNTKPVKVVWLNPMEFQLQTIAEGFFNITHNAPNVYTMNFSLHPNINDSIEKFEYTIGGDWECMSMFKELFNFDWDENTVLSRSEQISRDYKLILTDTVNDCRITCILQKLEY